MGVMGDSCYNSLCSTSIGVMGELLLQFYMLYEHRSYGGALLLQFFMLYEHRLSGNKDCNQQIVVDDQEL